MKRWCAKEMLDMGYTLFKKIYKRKRFAHHNHDIHLLHREIDHWLPQGIQAILEGSYSPRHLKRTYFKDGTVDQLHLTDRILQHIILKQIKTTFCHVMNSNCCHLLGPQGVKIATKRIRQILHDEKPNYVLRADIKSFYSTMSQYKLLQDVKKSYDDPKLIQVLDRIIHNPIETPNGYQNPAIGIALRGPLSQFFSALFLKNLDDAFSGMQVHYLRYQDDVIIFCKTKRQLQRCRLKMMEVLHERGLKLSHKKSHMGHISLGFHFLGIYYPKTQTLDYTTTANAVVDGTQIDLYSKGGDKSRAHQSEHYLINIVPHARTLRKARLQVQAMVEDGLSAPRIKTYLKLWLKWWVRASEIWQYSTLLDWFIQACFENNSATIYAAELLSEFNLQHSGFSNQVQLLGAEMPQPLHLQEYLVPAWSRDNLAIVL